MPLNCKSFNCQSNDETKKYSPVSLIYRIRIENSWMNVNREWIEVFGLVFAHWVSSSVIYLLFYERCSKFEKKNNFKSKLNREWKQVYWSCIGRRLKWLKIVTGPYLCSNIFIFHSRAPIIASEKKPAYFVIFCFHKIECIILTGQAQIKIVRLNDINN